MGASKTQTWIAGTALLALVIVAAAWLLLVSPENAEARAARDANTSALFEQDQLRSQVALLQTQYENLDEYQAELDAIALQIPAEPMLTEYVRTLQTVAGQYGVTITRLDPGLAVPYTEALGETAVIVATPSDATATDGSTNPVETAQDTAATAEDDSGASAGETTGGATESTTTAAPTETTTGLFAVPVTVVVLGTYANTNAFLDAVQNQVDRLLFVSTLSALRQDAADNSGTGRPATAAGDVELTINGFIYEYLVNPTPVVSDEAGTDEAGTETEPLPTTDRNPFASITGAG